MPIKVKKLIKELKKLDPNLVVGVAADQEGNAFHTFGGWSYAVYDKDASWGEEFASYVYKEDEEDGYEEEVEVTAETANAIILWP
ncbi:hypothetical protein SEA_ZOOMAN_217 [Microbacterium phage Zooman]|nr:hypothetical protein SEA_ZOOMAN_217 [Microbacterium phage Zooman]